MENTYDHLLRLLLIGDNAVGKTCLLLRFTEDVFESAYFTVGVSFQIRRIEIDGKKILLQIWDTAGHERYREMTRLYFRSVNGIMLVYDVTHPETFNNVGIWIREIEEHAPAEAEKIILGNKCDLDRQVSREEGEKLAIDYRIKFLETSAKSSINVEEAFFTLVRDIISRLDRKMSDCNPSAEGPVDIPESQSKSLFCDCCPLQ